MPTLKHSLLLIFIVIFYTAAAQKSDFKTIDFSKADYTAKLNAGKSLDNLPVLAHDLTARLDTDIEKFRAIYIWVCYNITGDIGQNNIVSRKRKKYKNDSLAYINWNNNYKKTAFKTLLKRKKTMCTGYAYLIKELCFLANIECEIINGYGRTIETNVKSLDMTNHSWNAVKLNNKWYLCDATWSSGYTLNDAMFIKEYNDGYFLADPILFASSHYPTDKKWFLNSTLAQSEYIAPPLVYGATFERQIIPISPQKMSIETKLNSEIDFSFKTLNTITNATVSLVYFSGIKEYAFKIYDLKNENGFIKFKNKFTQKGVHDVHLKIGNDVVATYTIEVIKS